MLNCRRQSIDFIKDFIKEISQKVAQRNTANTTAICIMWRPKFLFPEVEIPEPPAAPEDVAPVGEAEFKLEFESDEEWESEEDLKFGVEEDDAKENDGKEDSNRRSRMSSKSWANSNMNTSSTSLCSVSTISLEEALNNSQEFHADRGDLDFDMGDRWKTALKESLDQPIFLDFERQPRKEAIRKLGKKNGKKKKHGMQRRYSDSEVDFSKDI